MPVGGAHGSSIHGHWSRAGVAGKPLLPSGAGADRANPGCARLGWGRSLFLEALETSREGPAFSFPSFTDGVILICYVFVQGFFLLLLLFIYVLPFIYGIREAEPKHSRGGGEALGSPVWGGKSSWAANASGT